MVVVCIRETCAVRLTLADRRCCYYYYCVPVCLIIMSNTSAVEKSKPISQHSPTIRIHVELFEPTENRYPVFNYQKLLYAEEKKRRKKTDQQSNSFEENDESVKHLADHYEQKYGIIGVKKKKKKKTAFYNYSELAAGYDENDSFIDNTEIFDEVIPKEVETEHGGYYVNTGSLEFKKVYLSEDSEEVKSSQPRKHFINSVLEDSDEKLPNIAVNNSEKNSLTEIKTFETSTDSSSCSDERKSSKPIISPLIIMNGKIKRRQSIDSDSTNSIIPTKKKKISTVKSLIHEKRVQIPECKPSCSKDTQSISSEETPTAENISSISDTIESVIYAGCSKPLNLLLIPENNNVKNNHNEINPPISIDLPVSNGVHKKIEELPAIILEIIESIKTEAQIAIQNKSNIFSEQINLYLLSLEYQKELITFNSLPIYTILAEHLLCDKEKLVEQVNQLVDSEELKIIEPIKRLKNAIQKVIPLVIEQYNLECSKVLDKRAVNGISSDGLKSKSGPKRPRRKFPWNEEFRTYVRDIINIRTTTYGKIKKSHSVNDFIKQFINVKIKPLWPTGWMKSTNILKELKVKEKDSRPKLPKKQTLQNSPIKLISAIKMASEHKVSNSAMNKSCKWNKQKYSKTLSLSTGTTTLSTSHATSPAPSTTTSFKHVYNHSRSVTISTINNDTCPYQATITTTAVNGRNHKESENNSVIVKKETPAGDVLDLSPNKSIPVSFLNKLKDVTVICNNISQDNNSSAKMDLQISSKHLNHHPISRKQRLLQELHNAPSLPDQQRVSIPNNSAVDQQSIKPKDDKSIISSSNKLDCIKVDDKSTAKDMFCQIINESLMDNTSPLPSQFTTNSFYKPREDIKSPASNTVEKDIKKEYVDRQHNDRNTTSRTSSSHRSSSAELAEKEAQEVIRDLLVLNKLSSSCSSRNTRDNNVDKKHSSSVSMYSSRSPDILASSSLGVIHHPAFRNSYTATSSSNSTMCRSKNESTHGTMTLGIPKLNIGLPNEFFKHMVDTEKPSSRLTTDSYKKHGMPRYDLIQTNAQSSDKLHQQQFYSKLNTKPNQDTSHNSIKYNNTNE